MAKWLELTLEGVPCVVAVDEIKIVAPNVQATKAQGNTQIWMKSPVLGDIQEYRITCDQNFDEVRRMLGLGQH